MSTAFTDITIVEIEIPDHHVIGESRELDARFLAAAKDRRRLAARDERCELARYIARLARKTAERAAHCIHDKAFRLMDNLRRQVFVFQSRCVGAYVFGDRLHVVVRLVQ
jgi:hypothetical protein